MKGRPDEQARAQGAPLYSVLFDDVVLYSGSGCIAYHNSAPCVVVDHAGKNRATRVTAKLDAHPAAVSDIITRQHYITIVDANSDIVAAYLKTFQPPVLNPVRAHRSFDDRFVRALG